MITSAVGRMASASMSLAILSLDISYMCSYSRRWLSASASIVPGATVWIGVCRLVIASFDSNIWYLHTLRS